VIYRIIIAGSRDFDDYEYLKQRMDEFIMNEIHRLFMERPGEDLPKLEFVSGNCPPNKKTGKRGADNLGEIYARQRGYEPTPMPADWDKYGIAAGPIRNGEMAKYASEADYKACVIFWDGKSTGSQSMAKWARKFGIEPLMIKYKEAT
jgi:hypothetical protein